MSDELQLHDYGKVFAKGLMRDPIGHSQFKAGATKRVFRAAPVLPGVVDLSAKVSPPEDQGQCGSCWDFAITKALRSALMLAGKDPGTLAFNYLLNNCSGLSQAQMWGCQGGDFIAGMGMLGGKGPWLESQDPYLGSETSCKLGLKVAGTALDWVVVGDGQHAPTFQQLAEALANKHMLCVDVAADDTWAGYRSGVYGTNTSSGINHMINCVGYNMQTSVDANGKAVFNAKGQPINGDGYLILMNNWSEVWGEGGYMRSRWGMNSIAETAMYFTVKQPEPPVPPGPVPPPPPGPVPPPPVPPHPGPCHCLRSVMRVIARLSNLIEKSSNK